MAIRANTAMTQSPCTIVRIAEIFIDVFSKLLTGREALLTGREATSFCSLPLSDLILVRRGRHFKDLPDLPA
jgi:hypothetical protein